MIGKITRGLVLVRLLAFMPVDMLAQTAVWTGSYDNNRTGANINETILTPANVTAGQFGKLAAVSVSGCIFAQPLYVPGVIGSDGNSRDLFFVATATNMVYAFDANDYSLYFSANFGHPVSSADIDPEKGYYAFADCDDGDGLGPIGIIGTPVIDVANGAMYFVANTADSAGQHHFLHKIDLASGKDLASPVEIGGSYAGVPFQAKFHLQRSALLLLNQRIYVTFASHQDETPYGGWMFSYDTNFNQVAVMNYSPAKSGAGIWQSGGGPASDGQSIYFSTGNLPEDEADPTDNSDSILKVDPDTLIVQAKTSFYPEDINWDENFDLDLGSSRTIVIPGTTLVASGSKYGDLFVVDQGGMQLDSRTQVAARHSGGYDWTGVYNGFAYWNNIFFVWPGGGGYINGTDPGFPTDTLKALSLDPYSGAVTLLANGQSDGVAVGYQGSNIVISANGYDPSTAILWAHTPNSNTSWLQPADLHAYSASDFSNGILHELWNNIGLDPADAGAFLAKFSAPLIANGKVFLPTFSGKVIVYGFLPTTDTPPSDPAARKTPRAGRR
jgi:hypothetical protein